MTTDTTTETAWDQGVADTIEHSGLKPEKDSLPSPSTDAESVIRDQLTANTGTHFLDSGGAHGRAWQRNRTDPPWERPAWTVHDGYVTRTLHDFMTETFTRDRSCVALEAALYAFGTQPDRVNESWLTTVRDFTESAVELPTYPEDVEEWGVPRVLADDVAGLCYGIRSEHEGRPIFTENTYNVGSHPLDQDFMASSFGGPYADYVAVCVHGGADIRGGYTAPRVYKTFETWMPGEVEYSCHKCDRFSYSSAGRPEWATFKPDEDRVECNDCGGDVHFH